MFQSDEEIYITVIGSALLMVFLTSMIGVALHRYQKKEIEHLQEKAALQAQFEQEILTSQNEIQEQTMRYISQELHDNVAQMLSLVKIQLSSFQQKTPTTEDIVTSKTHLTAAISDLRALSKTLNTDNILHDGLSNAIRFELQRIQKTGIIVTDFFENVTALHLDHKQEIVVFRIFQELVHNILKHAEAKNIMVCLEASEKAFKLEVQDNGKGFDFEQKQKKAGFESGSGLVNIIHRVKLLNGTFKVNAAEGQGTVTTITLYQHDNHRPH